MNEADYIKATNRVKVSMALTILRDVLPSKNLQYGIEGQELHKVMHILNKIESRLFDSYEIKETNDE